MPSPKLDPVVLSDEERSVLGGWGRRRMTAQALALRARIVLACAEGGSVGQVAGDLGLARGTVSKWRSRFLADRLDGSSDEPRPRRPRTITDDEVERVVVKTREETPGQDTHWSTRSMAAATVMSQSAISRIWWAFGLKPHAVQTWKLSTAPRPETSATTAPTKANCSPAPTPTPPPGPMTPGSRRSGVAMAR
jgi:transposase